MTLDAICFDDPLPVGLAPRHQGFYAPHPLRCGRVGCCRPIAWMKSDARLPYLGFCDEHKTRFTAIPVTVGAHFSDWPEDLRAHAQRRLEAALAVARRRLEAA